MKRLIILAIAMALAPVADAQQLYKYVDQNGPFRPAPADVDSKQISGPGGTPAQSRR
jgi:hypothetical protein